MALTKIKLNTMVTGTLPDANIPDDITIDTAAAVPASGLTGNTLASGVTASSLTSVGTLTGLASSGTIVLGDLDIIPTSSNVSVIKHDSGSGSLTLQGDQVNIKNRAGDETGLSYNDGSGIFFGGDFANYRLYSKTGVEIGTLAFNEYFNGSAWVNDDSDIVSGAVRFSDSRDSLEFGVRAGGAGAGYSTSHMVVKSTGRIGVGTNNPDTLIHAKVTTNTSESIKIQNDDSMTTMGVSSDGYSFQTYQHSLQYATWDGSTWVGRATLDGSGNFILKNFSASGTNSQSLPGYLSFQGNGWDSDSGSDPIEGRITFTGSYGGTGSGAHSGGGVIPKLEFGIVNSGDAGSTSESLTTVMSVHGAQHDLTGGSVSIAGGQSTYSSLGVGTGGTNTYSETGGTHHQNSAITIDFPNADQSYGAIRWRSHGNMENFFGVVQQGASGQGDWVWQCFDGSAYDERMRLSEEGLLAVKWGIDSYGLYLNGLPSSVTKGILLACGPSSGTVDAALFRDGSGHNCGAIYLDATNNTTNYSTSSDYRLKENEEIIPDGIERIKKLKPYKFNFKSNPDKTKVDGFFAHELAEHIPEAVDGEKDQMEDGEIKPQSVDYGKVTPLLVKAVQELIAKVEALENA